MAFPEAGWLALTYAPAINSYCYANSCSYSAVLLLFIAIHFKVIMMIKLMATIIQTIQVAIWVLFHGELPVILSYSNS